ncbi:hypothetical protein [Mucilaginibacter psychrotolerans]|uniref:Uncharacterized protein n=1 Tax=Mucilaginibacter psychrotolerans TaxID=1524096 RepID=A0A4Y8SP52_9SPHI|nr:hypothetical protein [Mucilaginibacter psychrotolerans]TFF40400.1 hypothetical protein E2R66_03895 [Mucilaginibacter psychrotolerans]
MQKNPHLKRYWFQFEDIPLQYMPAFGVGVTAYSYEDAIDTISKTVFENMLFPHVTMCIENIDVSTLDVGHVLLNMLPSTFRGVWYPAGFHEIQLRPVIY